MAEGFSGVKISGKSVAEGENRAVLTHEVEEALEKMFCERPFLNLEAGMEMVKQHPLLSGIENEQIKCWLQKRWIDEIRRQRFINHLTLTDKLSATRKLLLARNERLTEEVLRLERENQFYQKLLQNVRSTNESGATSNVVFVSGFSRQSFSQAADNFEGHLLLPENVVEKFLTVAEGSCVGVPFSLMKELTKPFGTEVLPCIGQLSERTSRELILTTNNKHALLETFIQKLSGGLPCAAAAECLIKAATSMRKLGFINDAMGVFSDGVLDVKVSLKFNNQLTNQREMDLAGKVVVVRLKAQTAPGSLEVAPPADWTWESFRQAATQFELAGVSLKFVLQNRDQVLKLLCYIEGVAVFCIEICPRNVADRLLLG